MTKYAAPACYALAMEIVYLDLVFLIDLAADYLLLLWAARLFALPLRRRRYLLGALLGAAWSAASLLPGLEALQEPGWALLAGVAMGLIAYGAEERPLGCTGAFLLLSAAMGGALWALELSLGPIKPDMKLLALAFLTAYVLLGRIFSPAGAPARRAHCQVQVSLGDRRVSFTALVDSGNCLIDPVSGKGVLVASPRALSPLLGEGGELLETPDPVELLERAAGIGELRGRLGLVPYSGLGGRGLMAVLRPDELLINGRPCKDRLLGISQQAAGAGFQGIL